MEPIWIKYGRAQIDLFASQKTTLCPLWFALTHPAPLGLDGMVQTWPRWYLYAFPPIALLPGVLESQKGGYPPLLIAPFWPAKVWFSDLLAPLAGQPWEIPLRRKLLTQAGGVIFHPCPEMRKLWVWPEGDQFVQRVSQPRLLRPSLILELPPSLNYIVWSGDFFTLWCNERNTDPVN